LEEIELPDQGKEEHNCKQTTSKGGPLKIVLSVDRDLTTE